MRRFFVWPALLCLSCSSWSYASGDQIRSLDGLTSLSREKRVIVTDGGKKRRIGADSELVVVLSTGQEIRGPFEQIAIRGDTVYIQPGEAQYLLKYPCSQVVSVGVRRFSFAKTFWLSAAILVSVATVAYYGTD